MLILYQFPISHYCEKARWALDYKGANYRLHNLLPGLHGRKTLKLAKRSSVPVLKNGREVVQGSAEIISYLDGIIPDKALTPENEQLRREALEWEHYVDIEIGIPLRRCCYHILLEYPEIVIGFFTHNGPFYGKFLLRRIFPELKKRMQERMDIRDEIVEESRETLERSIDRLSAHMEGRSFLVGDNFSRADLAAAALLAPLRMPDAYGLSWPEKLPEDFQKLVSDFASQLAWVDRIYESHR